jgi:hypothetical protein
MPVASFTGADEGNYPNLYSPSKTTLRADLGALDLSMRIHIYV